MPTNPDLKTSDYITSTGIALQGLRLLVEGAVHLCNKETGPLFRPAMTHDHDIPAQSFASVGEALYLLRDRIGTMQQAYIAEIKRQDSGTAALS